MTGVAPPARGTGVAPPARGTGVALAARGIGHSYGRVAALDGVDLDVPEGEVTVLIGPSGCGKSTLLGILGGLIAPDRGEVRLRGRPATDCLNPIACVFQDFALLPWMSVAGNVDLVLRGKGLPRAARAAIVAEVLALTGLSAFAGAWPRQLSGGMKQRVGIARALAVRPSVMLMDEPLSALDAQTRALLMEEFAGLIARSGVTTVWVTHNLAEATRLGHRIVVLGRRPGRVRDIISLDRPLAARRAGDADLAAVEARLWDSLRDEAAEAARELADG